MGPIILINKYIIMVQSSLTKTVFFSAREWMHHAAYIFLQWQIILPVETADINYSLGSVVM